MAIGARCALMLLAATFATLLAASGPAAAGDDPPAVRMERSPTAGGDAAHLLARPIGTLYVEGANVRELLGRIAWLLGVEIAVDSSAAGRLAAAGERTLDVRGGDGADLLELAVGLVPRVERARVVLHRRRDARTTDSPSDAVASVSRTTNETTVVRGRVLTAAGRGIGGACVAADGLPPGRTDESGRFSCRVPYAGAPVIAWMAGRAPSEAVVSGRREFDVLIGSPVAQIDVRAVGAGGSVLCDALAYCGGSGETAPLGLRRGDRRVRLDGLPTGGFPLVVTARGHGAVRCSVPTRTGETTTVTATLRSSTLGARVRDERASVRARDVRLTVALWELMQLAALPLKFEASLGEAGRRTVSIDRQDAPLAEILDELCHAASASWRVDESAWVVRIERE